VRPHKYLCIMAVRLLFANIVATALTAPTVTQAPTQAPTQPPTQAQQTRTLEKYKSDKSAAENATKAAAAVQAKMSAMDKVINLLGDLQKQVLGEGETEAASYNQFSCFCKDTIEAKNKAISSSVDEIAKLQGFLATEFQKRVANDGKISKADGEIAAATLAIDNAKASRAKTLGKYEKDAADLTGAIEALTGAIRVLKASKTPSLVQLNAVAETVKTAGLMADALGLANSAELQRSVGFFVQMQEKPEDFRVDVGMEDYKFHSNDVIATLEKLMKDFRQKKVDVDQAEVTSVKDHELLVQSKTDEITDKTLELNQARAARSAAITEIAAYEESLSTTASDLLDDREYLKETDKMCTDGKKTWDQRTTTRGEELQTLTAAMKILQTETQPEITAATIRFVQNGMQVRLAESLVSNEAGMEAVEAEAEAAEEAADRSQPVGFLQRSVRRHQMQGDGRSEVAKLLLSQGSKLHSTLLTSLASQVTADPFAKVKQLIQELIERLLLESSSESTQKGWCDKETAANKQKRDYAVQKVTSLNGHMANLEGRRNKLTQQISDLTTTIKDIEDARADASKIRSEQKTENTDNIATAGKGKVAVEKAIQLLDRWYKTHAKDKVAFSQLSKGPYEDAPSAGFKLNEAYKGGQGEAGGILGLLDVIRSDFARTMSETAATEKEQVKEHFNFITESGKSLAEKKTVKQERVKQNTAANAEYTTADGDLDTQIAVLKGALAELVSLKAACIDTGMSYNDRVANREQEIQVLNTALCILGNFAEYGPGGSQNC